MWMGRKSESIGGGGFDHPDGGGGLLLLLLLLLSGGRRRGSVDEGSFRGWVSDVERSGRLLLLLLLLLDLILVIALLDLEGSRRQRRFSGFV